MLKKILIAILALSVLAQAQSVDDFFSGVTGIVTLALIYMGVSAYRKQKRWRESFAGVNGREPTKDEVKRYAEDISEDRPAPDLTNGYHHIDNPKPVTETAISTVNQTKDRRHVAKSLADWEDNLTVIWAGSETVEFSYEARHQKRSRRKVTVQELCVDQYDNLCLVGLCHLRQEKRTFKAQNIVTKIKVGSKRYDLEDWVEDVLKVDLNLLDNVAY